MTDDTPATDGHAADPDADKILWLLGGNHGVDDPASEGDEFDLAGVGAIDLLAPPVHWPSVPATEVASRLRALWYFVDELQNRFPQMVRLPACWYKHNGVVELLQALSDHERASFADTAPPTAAVGWHMVLNDIESRLRPWLSALDCDRGHRVPAPSATLPPAVDDWAASVRERSL